MGKKRVQQKRDLEEVVGVPIRAVDPRNLYVSDVKELGQRIQRSVIVTHPVCQFMPST